MLDLLASVPTWAWWMLGVFSWLACSFALMGVWRSCYDGFWDTPGPMFASLFFPFVIWYFVALAVSLTIHRRRVCPKCKSTF